ncbi:hypothetical protein D8674_033694 [Pyrus ussuriensis x Pyrus communis]|uniref:PB1-like domain-containing protein n=1 Tax=Pyrus ussuriensis x Pyrus communis TaxID=2448454 RepID=A0A5N5HLU0_9ROSA|nr:hypothetical protein D8674_033694 [Pyrus ussuriensis x Pyrus communis]
MTWEMREDPLDPFPTYFIIGFFYAAISGNNDLFTIKMYHGGQLSEDFYVGGKVDFFDYCDKDFMSLLEVDNIVEELGYGNIFMKMEFMKSFEPIAQSRVVVEELDGDEDDQCNLIEKRPVQVNRGKAKLAIEYPVNGLGGECSVPSQCVIQAVKEVPDEMGDRIVGDGVVGEGVPDERVADEGVKDEVVDIGDEGAEEEDENDSDFIEEEFPAHEDHLHFMKFVDDHVDAQEDAIFHNHNSSQGKAKGQSNVKYVKKRATIPRLITGIFLQNKR